ncbi:DUF2516 family protein [Luteipulveratus sp. YIM 133132]|uniref:DUF2516 family protein n=1 Tax=Luteipulveratus flavus TaxID=3031728 RepID=A0ABT6C9Y6_9MICO|nr:MULTISPECIES: DUF2516 family protein [unclassified Luteipulveratus]MDE9365534.1 DUF2516 family protein [Luteipulveratus sp. YIM 133132]MDF8265551.1 DUF2516 family protein [Luteipulveratus sp. YIM 133296]
MNNGLFQVQNVVALVLSIALFVMQLSAFVDALRHREDAYRAAGKLTKVWWCAITGVCAALGLLSLGNPLSIFEIIAVVGAAVYLADVRPALHRVMGRGRNEGPYGPW